MSDGHSIPPAWYPDPADTAKLRYWDGANWTEKVIDRAAAAAALPSMFTPPPAQPPPIGQQAPGTSIGSQGFGTAFTEPVTSFTGYSSSSFDSPSYVPLSRPVPTTTRESPRRVSTTAAIWLWALAPLLLLVHLVLPWDYSADDYSALIIHGSLLLASVVLSVALAAVDRRGLLLRGFDWAPSSALGLLPPVHSLVRVFAVGAGGVPVALVSLTLQGVVLAVLLVPSLPAALLGAAAPMPTPEPHASTGMVAPFTAEQLAYLLTPEGMAEKLRYDSAQTDLPYEAVDCAPLGTADAGAQTTCTATGSLVDYSIVVEAIPDSSGTPFTVVSVVPQPY